jgi:MFS transporter, DHA2 family, glioxin efflux transporter
MLGGAFLVSIGESIFVNRLVSQLLINAPEMDPTVVAAVGATGLRQAFTETELPGIVLSCMLVLKSVYAFTVALAGTATIIGAFSSWKSIKGKAYNRGSLMAMSVSQRQ